MEHADLDDLIDRAGAEPPHDDLTLRRLKKRRLLLRDQISRLEAGARSADTGVSAPRERPVGRRPGAAGRQPGRRTWRWPSPADGPLARSDPALRAARGAAAPGRSSVAQAIDQRARAGGRGRHRRRQDLRLPGAAAAVGPRARWSAPPPRACRTSCSCATCRACATRCGVPVTLALLKGRASYLCLHRLQPARQGAATARPLGGARAGPRRALGAGHAQRRPGRDRRAWTSARR